MEELEDHDLGLSHDLPKILGRRGLLGLFGAAGIATVAVACASDDPELVASQPRQPTVGTQAADGEIPEETAGPYPGDGSNGVNVLTESGIVRSDLTSSFGDASGVAEGVPVTVRLKVYDLDGEDVAARSEERRVGKGAR